MKNKAVIPFLLFLALFVTGCAGPLSSFQSRNETATVDKVLTDSATTNNFKLLANQYHKTYSLRNKEQLLERLLQLSDTTWEIHWVYEELIETDNIALKVEAEAKLEEVCWREFNRATNIWEVDWIHGAYTNDLPDSSPVRMKALEQLDMYFMDRFRTATTMNDVFWVGHNSPSDTRASRKAWDTTLVWLPGALASTSDVEQLWKIHNGLPFFWGSFQHKVLERIVSVTNDPVELQKVYKEAFYSYVKDPALEKLLVATSDVVVLQELYDSMWSRHEKKKVRYRIKEVLEQS